VNESEALHNDRDYRLSVHVYCRQYQTVQFLSYAQVPKSSADLHLYDSELQTEGALTLNAFTDNASAIRGTVSNDLSDDRNVRAGR